MLVTLRGDARDIALAKNRLRAFIDSHWKVKDINLHEKFIPDIVLSRFQSEIRQIKIETNANIQFVREEYQSKLTITGAGSNVLNAEQRLQQLLDQISKQVVHDRMDLTEEDTLFVEKEFKNISSLGQKCCVVVDLHKQENALSSTEQKDDTLRTHHEDTNQNRTSQNYILLIGLSNDVEDTKKQIQDFLNSQKVEKFVDDVDLPQSQIQELESLCQKCHAQGHYISTEKRLIIRGYREFVAEARSECLEYLRRPKSIQNTQPDFFSSVRNIYIYQYQYQMTVHLFQKSTD